MRALLAVLLALLCVAVAVQCSAEYEDGDEELDLLSLVEADETSAAASASADELITQILHEKLARLKAAADTKDLPSLNFSIDHKIRVVKPLRDHMKAIFMPGGKYESGHSADLAQTLHKLVDPQGALRCVVESLARKNTYKCIQATVSENEVVLSDFQNPMCAKVFLAKVAEKCKQFAESHDPSVRDLPLAIGDQLGVTPPHKTAASAPAAPASAPAAPASAAAPASTPAAAPPQLTAEDESEMDSLESTDGENFGDEEFDLGGDDEDMEEEGEEEEEEEYFLFDEE